MPTTKTGLQVIREYAADLKAQRAHLTQAEILESIGARAMSPNDSHIIRRYSHLRHVARLAKVAAHREHLRRVRGQAAVATLRAHALEASK